MTTKYDEDGMPIIWPWLDEDDTRRRSLLVWLVETFTQRCSDQDGPSASRSCYLTVRDLLAFYVGQENLNVMPGNWLAWNEVGTRLGYTVWATVEEGNGR